MSDGMIIHSPPDRHVFGVIMRRNVLSTCHNMQGKMKRRRILNGREAEPSSLQRRQVDINCMGSGCKRERECIDYLSI